MPGGLAYRVYWCVITKKITDSFSECAANEGVDEERPEGYAAAGHVIKEYFGDSLLFICYEFLNEVHMKPKNWKEIFEFAKFSKTKGILKEMATASARAKSNAGEV